MLGPSGAYNYEQKRLVGAFSARAVAPPANILGHIIRLAMEKTNDNTAPVEKRLLHFFAQGLSVASVSSLKRGTIEVASYGINSF